ncbi:MAG TPA: MMPL family transporter [Candidatus Acidoferrum sp.]|nr:MMPL family transporter [Candidatus Acidoferrum sp.]
MSPSQVGRLLRRLVRLSCRRPWLTLGAGVLLAIASVVYALTTLTFATSTRALLPRNEPYILRYVQYDKEFGDLDDLAIVVEAPSLPEATVYAGRLVRELKEARVPLARLAYRIDPKQFEGRALLYLSLDKLSQIRERIFDYQEFMESFAARPTLDQLVDGVATQIANAFLGGFLDLGLSEQSKGSLDLRFVRDLIAQISTRVERPAPYQSPWGALFSVGGDSEGAGYFLSDDQRLLFILAQPESEKGSFTGDRRAIEGVRGVVARLKREFPDVNVGVTGKQALANDEMTAAFDDSERGTYLAFALTLGLLVMAFLRIGKPLVLLTILTLSLCWSIGVTTLVIGHLSLFSVVFISIVIGIGIDYGVYLLFRYEEELFLGRNLREALEITAARTGPGVLLSAATAAATFYVLCFTAFRGVQELGFISGTAILLSWLVMMTVFPATLVLIDRRHANRPRGTVPRAIALESIHVPLVDRITGHPRTVLAVAAVLTAASALALGSVRFDYNLLNLQADGTESVAWEKKILATSGRSGFAALSAADTLDELRRKQQAFRKLKTVSEVDSALLLIPDQQAEKQKVIADFAPIVGPVRISRPLRLDLDRLISTLDTLKRRFDVASAEAPEGDTRRDVTRVAQDIGRLVIKLRQSDPETATAALTLLQRQVYGDFVTSFQRLQSNLNPRMVGLADVPPEIKRKFVSDRGRFLLQIHPAVNIWDRDGAARFVADLRSVDPEVTGTPIITHEAILLMERAYKQGTLYAIILVSGMTFLMLRRVRESLLALLPLALGLVWTMGLMYVFDLKFNLGNVFGLPLILGAAAEYGLIIVIRFMEAQRHGGALVPRSTIMGVLVSGLTTITGFGTLLLAHHRGIYGLGLLLTLGSAASLIASLIVLPVLLRLRHERGQGRRAAASSQPTTLAPSETAPLS